MIPPPLPARARNRRTKGFSLIEVTLAIGIVAFAFISLFGLVPTGLNVFRDSIDTTIGSQIVQQVTDAAQQTDFINLVSNSTLQPTYYDAQGNLLANSGVPITDAGDPLMKSSIYTVRVTVNPRTNIPATGENGGVNTTINSTSNVATLTIQIAKNPGHDPNPFTSTKNIAVNNYVAYVARNLSAYNAVSATQ